MATLRDIRQRIVSVKNTAKITSAMKMVSAAKMKRAQTSIESARPYFSKLEAMVSNLVEQAGDEYSHVLANARNEVRNIAIIVISSDRGLCGSFNTNLFKSLTMEIEDSLKHEFPDAAYHFIPVGKKATAFYKKSKVNCINEFPGIFAELDFQNARDIVESVSKLFLEGEIDRVFVYYNEFVNIIKQLPKLHSLLPIMPEKSNNQAENIANTDYIYEPTKTGILDVLLPKLVDIIVWRSLLESNAAEQAARMMAMEKATTNAKDLIRSLELQYNKARQAAITTEMLEIVSGAEALRTA